VKLEKILEQLKFSPYHNNFYSNQESPHLLSRNMCGHLFYDGTVKVEEDVTELSQIAKKRRQITIYVTYFCNITLNIDHSFKAALCGFCCFGIRPHLMSAGLK
jgi:hypothetical protein